MMFNHAMNFLFWLFGVLQVVGCIGGLVSLAFLFWLYWPRRHKEEVLCARCRDAESCEAAYTGVAYPCRYYEEV